MKHDSKVISIQRASAFRLDPTLTGEEAVVLRLLLVETPTGKCATQLRMHSDIYLRMMRGMREKIHMADNASLIAWAKERIKGGFSRPLFRESTDVFSHRNPSASWQELSSNRRPIITASAVERLLATAPIDAKAYPTSGFALISLLR